MTADVTDCLLCKDTFRQILKYVFCNSQVTRVPYSQRQWCYL